MWVGTLILDWQESKMQQIIWKAVWWFFKK
jgi:hypothetical protein